MAKSKSGSGRIQDDHGIAFCARKIGNTQTDDEDMSKGHKR